MQIGVIGLGRMGGTTVRGRAEPGNPCIVFDQHPAAISALARESRGASSLDDLVGKLEAPRALWLMLPAGEITEQTVMKLAGLLSPGDVIVDGGKSFCKDDIRRAALLWQKGIHYVDVGTSGGVWGLERGYCMMIGGDKEVVNRLDPIFAALAPGAGGIPLTPGLEGRDPRVERGYMHFGPNGAGPFVMMVHNGIEYALVHASAHASHHYTTPPPHTPPNPQHPPPDPP